MEIVVKAGFEVEVLTGEAKGSMGGGARIPGSGAPQGGARAGGDGAGFVEEFGGGADEVGNDGEEALIGLVLRGVGCGAAFALGQGVSPSWSQVRVVCLGSP